MSRFFALIHRLGEGIRDPQAELTRLQAAVRYGYLLSVHGGRQLLRHRAPLLAGALSFRTIFSLVPVLALVLVTLRFVFGEEGIRKGLTALMEYTGLSQIALQMDVFGQSRGSAGAASGVGMEPGGMLRTNEWQSGGFVGPMADGSNAVSAGPMMPIAADESGNSLTAWIETFVANATTQVTDLNLTGITLVSLAVFIYAAMSLLIQVESAFNVVLGARRGRRWALRVPIYWTLLTFGSLLIAGGIYTGQVFQEGIDDLPGWLAWLSSPARLMGAVFMSWLVLVFAYRWLPSARIGWRATAVGALVAAVGFEGAKNALAGLIRFVAEGQVVVYGSLALVPLTLLWVYVVWLIVLFGLELANAVATLSDAQLRGELRRSRTEAVLPSMSLAAGLAVLVAQRFEAGKVATIDGVSERLAAPSGHVLAVAEVLVARGVIRWIEHDEDTGTSKQAMTLGAPAASVPLSAILQAQRDVAYQIGDPSVARSCRVMEAAQDRALESTTLADLLRGDFLETNDEPG